MADNKIPGWLLERYLLGELPKSKLKKMRIQLKKNPNLREEIKRLEKSDKDILDKYPPASIVPEIMNRYNKEKNSKENIIRATPIFFKRVLYLSPVFVSALVIFFIGLQIYKSNLSPSKNIEFEEGTREKGRQSQHANMQTTHLIVHRKNNSNIELLESGVKAKAGDLLQLAYVAARESHGVIFSIDGNGTVTLHFPGKKNESTVLKQKKKVFLASAYELDDAPEFERFFFITSNSEIDVEQVLKSAEALAKNPGRIKNENIGLKETLNQYTILIKKGD